MRVTFPRLPDHRRAYSLVERDDGVVFRLYGGTAGPRLPNDIMHLVVERELRIPDGIWGGIAAGAVGASLRPPGLRAELLASLVERVAALDHPSARQIRSLAAARLGAATRDADVDPAAIAAAATALQVEASRWARLRVGEELSYEWPPGAGTDPGREPRIVRPRQNRDGREPGRGGRPVISVVPRARNPDHGQMDARPDEVIETGAATLRRYRADDLDALMTAMGESYDHLRPWSPWVIGYSRESEAGFLAGAERGWRDGTVYNWAIVVDGVLTGGISLMARIGAGGLEIGYWVHQAYTRRGLATAAAAAMVEQAFRLPGIHRVEIVHDELNVASGGVPRKLGFTEAGRRPLEIRPPAGTGIGVVWRLVR